MTQCVLSTVEMVKRALSEIDKRKARPMSDILLGNGDVVDASGVTPRQRLAELESEAQELRARLL